MLSVEVSETENRTLHLRIPNLPFYPHNCRKSLKTFVKPVHRNFLGIYSADEPAKRLGITLQNLQLTVNGLYKKLCTDKGAVAQLKFKADAGLLLKYRYFKTLSKNTDIVRRRWSDRELSPALPNSKSSILSTQHTTSRIFWEPIHQKISGNYSTDELPRLGITWRNFRASWFA